MAGGRGGGGTLLHLQEDQPAYLRNRGKDASLGTAPLLTMFSCSLLICTRFCPLYSLYSPPGQLLIDF